MSEAAKLFNRICKDQSDAPNVPCSHYILGGFCTLGNHFRCPEYIVHNEPPLSYSAINTYSSCHRKYYWQQLVGLEKIDKSWAMQLGSHTSTILGWLHNSTMEISDAVNFYNDYIEALLKETTDPEDEERIYGHVDIWKMKAMFDAYIALGYFHQERGITEYEFRWNEIEYPRVHGFIDLVQLITPEKHTGYEFKWTGNPDNYGKFINGDQYAAYFIGDPKMELMVNRCFVPPDMRPRRATKKQSAESIFDFYQRVYDDIIQMNVHKYFINRKFWVSEFDLGAYQNKAKRVAQEIMRYIDEGGIEPFYQNTSNCLNPFRCDYLQVCENDILTPWEMTDAYQKRGGNKNAEGIRKTA
jgi:hypothetical protein